MVAIGCLGVMVLLALLALAMPLEIEQDGKKVTVYTKEELDGAVTAAKTGLLSEEDAKKLADTAAAGARKEAEKKLKELQDELAKAGQSAEKVAELEKQIAEQAGKITSAERSLLGLKVLAGAGLSPAAAEQLLALPVMASADLSSEDGQKKAVEGVKGLFPQLFAAAGGGGDDKGEGGEKGKPAFGYVPLGGVGGSPAPGGGVQELAAQIAEAEKKGDWNASMALKEKAARLQRGQAG